MIGTNFGIYRPNNVHVPQQIPTATKNEDRDRPHQLSDFMLQLEDYVPTVPDAVTAHYLNLAGFESNDPRIVRLISVATQKFISDIANDALQHSKTRTNSHNSSKIQKTNKEKKYTLTLDDVTPALADYGITTRKPQYYI